MNSMLKNRDQLVRKEGRAIGPIGTAGRGALGLGFLGLAWILGLPWYEALLGLVVVPAALLLFQGGRLLFTSAPLRATGPIGYCVNIGVGAAIFMWSPSAALVFYGFSLLLAAMRGYAGCEILAVSNWLLRRDDEVGCVIFSPIDAIEAQMSGRERAEQC